MAARKSRSDGRSFFGSVWLFPAVLFVVVLLLAAFRISGSSVGYYNQLYSGSGHDRNLIYGEPRKVRSDEWLVATAMTVAQSKHNFASVNPSIGQGLDMSVIFDVPYREWSEVFHPQNLPFFVMPLENAFAMKWWLLDFGLAVGAYFFVLALLPGRRLLAAGLGLGLMLSPFVQWWYQTITIAPLAYALILVALFAASLRTQRCRTQIILGAAMAYFFACFILVLYPPFQVPCAIVAGLVGLGLWLELKNPKTSWPELLKKLIPAVAALIVAAALVGAFWLQHENTIKTVENTVYPGHRTVEPGGFGLLHYFDGFIDHQLQFEAPNQHYVSNQSEASNFVYLWPFLLLPSLLLSYRRWRKKGELEWAPLLINLVLLVFTADLFLPLPDLFLKLTGLALVPHNRLLIGIGMANFALIPLLLRQLHGAKLPRRAPLLFGLLCFVVLWADGLILHLRHPWFITGVALFTVLAAAVASSVYLFLKSRPQAAALLLLLIGLLSVYRVSPLYRGLSPLTGSLISQTIAHESEQGSGKWIVLDDFYSINLPAAAGVPTISATYSYPQLAQWRQEDPSGQLADVYNRYGSAIFTLKQLTGGFELRSPDSFLIRYSPCDPTEFNGQIGHILSLQPIDSQCVELLQKVIYPKETFYLYRPAL